MVTLASKACLSLELIDLTTLLHFLPGCIKDLFLEDVNVS